MKKAFLRVLLPLLTVATVASAGVYQLARQDKKPAEKPAEKTATVEKAPGGINENEEITEADEPKAPGGINENEGATTEADEPKAPGGGVAEAPGNDETLPVEEDKPPLYASVRFESVMATFDGQAHTITATGVPAGVEVHYANNSAVNMGVHRAFLRLYHAEWGERLMTATITITKSEIKGLSFSDATFAYDGTVQNIKVAGEIPEGIEVAYTMDGKPFEGATEVGSYKITAKLTGGNYDDLTLTATMKIEKAEITGISFNDRSYTYNGSNRTMAISGSLPAGTSVAYTDEQGKAFTGRSGAGSYLVKATITGPNYQTLELWATLTINKANITGITFNGLSTVVDGELHNIKITGSLPGGVAVKYTLDSSEGPVFEGASAQGVYDVVATMTGPNHNTLVLNAQLVIAPGHLSTVVGLELSEVPAKPEDWAVGTTNVVLSWDAVPNAGSYVVHITYKDGTLATMVHVAEGTTYNIKSGIWEVLLRDTYNVQVMALPVSGDPNYAPSLLSEPITYKHEGRVQPPTNIRVEDGMLKWDPAPVVDRYNIQITELSDSGSVISTSTVYWTDIKDLQISVKELIVYMKLPIPGNYRFTVRAGILTGGAWVPTLASPWGTPTEVVRVE